MFSTRPISSNQFASASFAAHAYNMTYAFNWQHVCACETGFSSREIQKCVCGQREVFFLIPVEQKQNKRHPLHPHAPVHPQRHRDLCYDYIYVIVCLLSPSQLYDVCSALTNITISATWSSNPATQPQHSATITTSHPPPCSEYVSIPHRYNYTSIYIYMYHIPAQFAWLLSPSNAHLKRSAPG